MFSKKLLENSEKVGDDDVYSSKMTKIKIGTDVFLAVTNYPLITVNSDPIY